MHSVRFTDPAAARHWLTAPRSHHPRVTRARWSRPAVLL